MKKLTKSQKKIKKHRSKFGYNSITVAKDREKRNEKLKRK